MSYELPSRLSREHHPTRRQHEASSHVRWHQEREHRERVGRPTRQADRRVHSPRHSHRVLRAPDEPAGQGMEIHQRTRAQDPYVRAGLEVARSARAHRAAQHRRRELGSHGAGGRRSARGRRRLPVPVSLDAGVGTGRPPAVPGRGLGGTERRQHGDDAQNRGGLRRLEAARRRRQRAGSRRFLDLPARRPSGLAREHHGQRGALGRRPGLSGVRDRRRDRHQGHRRGHRGRLRGELETVRLLTLAGSRRPKLGLRFHAVVAVLAIAAAAAPAAARAADAPRELARRYAPVVRLVEQRKPCAHGEPFVPTNVSLLLGNPDVALRGPWGGTNLIQVGPTGAELGKGLWGYHLDFPGSALTPNCSYDKWSRRLNKGHRPLTYARVATDSLHPGQIALQYWFFYVFNNFNDKHEGDWEMIQLDFDAATAAQALRRPPAIVGYSQHQGAESAEWGDSKLELVGGTHPVVYAALGSHANYFTSALHLGRSAAQGVGCDDTSEASHQVRPEVDVVPTRKADYMLGYPWLGFEGHWGEDHSGFYNGPTGPNTKLQWRHPITWATKDWRDKSFTVPIGTFAGV